MEAATTHRHAAAVETSTAQTSTAHTHAAVETTSATTKAAATAAVATPTTARQRHCWRSQTDRRNCQQRDHCLTQHSHPPSEIPLPTPTRITGGDRSGKALLASTSPLLNSAREIKLKFSKRVVRTVADVIELEDLNKKKRPPDAIATILVCTENLIRVDEVKESPKLTE
jgi:hypothetical protein